MAIKVKGSNGLPFWMQIRHPVLKLILLPLYENLNHPKPAGFGTFLLRRGDVLTDMLAESGNSSFRGY